MLCWDYLLHFFKAKRRHGIHPPFVYAFSQELMSLFPIWNFAFNEEKRKRTAQSLMNLTQLFLVNYGKEHFKPEAAPMLSVIYDLPPEGFRPQPLVFYLLMQPTERVGAKKWKAWKQKSKFNLVIDAWHIALFCNHPAFKDKQQYLLR